MTDKNPLAHYSGVLSESVQESAAADVPASGAAALSQYLKDCEQHSIIPDVGGAFAFAFAAGFNLATTQAAPIAWPKDAQDVRDFFRSDFITAQFHAQDQAPCDEDRYLISAHDFLSAVNWWADFPHVPREPQAAPAAVAVPDERAAFERVVKETMHDAPEDHIAERLACWPDGAYKDRSTGYAWWAWQHRAALAATPAAVEVPAEGDPAALLQLAYLIESGRGMNYVERKEIAVALRVLAATPAADGYTEMLEESFGITDPAVAPVVLPEPHASGQVNNTVIFHFDDAAQAREFYSATQSLQLSVAAPKAQADARYAQLLAFAVSEIRRDEMEHEPVLYVSKGQLGNFRDPDGPDSTAHGRYLPARVTPAGKFTTPLFAAPQAEAADFQQRVQPWMMACFGPEISADRSERNHRFLEEALELVQSCGCTASEAHQLVDYVYSRPWGEPAQEAGGVMVTLAALCLANGLDMHECGETELARIWTKVEAIRAKQAAKPKHSPLPMQAPQTQDGLRLAFVLSEIRRDGMDALSAALHDLDGFPLDHQASVEAIDRAAIAAAKGEQQ